MASSVPSLVLSNGKKMPIIGIGTYKSKYEETKTIVTAALENGYRHFDTAYLYQNEDAIGDVIYDWINSDKVARDDLFITTKLPMIANRASDVGRFLDKSLKNLQLSYLDLYLIHNPVGMKGQNHEDVWPLDDEGNTVLDFDTDLESIYKAMEEQHDAGKTKAIGISNFNSKQIERIMKVCRIKPAVIQVEIHAYHQQRQLREFCSEHGIPICAYAPIAAPYKTAGRSSDSPILLEHPTVLSISKAHQKSPAQVLIRFLIQMHIAVIPKSAKPERIRENFQVFDFELSSSEMSALQSLDQGGNGRIFLFEDVFKGISRHPEWTFHIPF